MNILQALDDPKLFGSTFTGPTWAAWRAFLASLFALPLDAAASGLYCAHPAFARIMDGCELFKGTQKKRPEPHLCDSAELRNPRVAG